MAAITQPRTHAAFTGRRYGSFAGKTQTVVLPPRRPRVGQVGGIRAGEVGGHQVGRMGGPRVRLPT